MKMHDRSDQNFRYPNLVDDSIREAFRHGASSSFRQLLPRFGVLHDAVNRLEEFIQEFVPKPGRLAVVEFHCGEEFFFGFA